MSSFFSVFLGQTLSWGFPPGLEESIAHQAIAQAMIDDVTRHIGQQKVYDDLTLAALKQT